MLYDGHFQEDGGGNLLSIDSFNMESLSFSFVNDKPLNVLVSAIFWIKRKEFYISRPAIKTQKDFTYMLSKSKEWNKQNW